MSVYGPYPALLVCTWFHPKKRYVKRCKTYKEGDLYIIKILVPSLVGSKGGTSEEGGGVGRLVR